MADSRTYTTTGSEQTQSPPTTNVASTAVSQTPSTASLPVTALPLSEIDLTGIPIDMTDVPAFPRTQSYVGSRPLLRGARRNPRLVSQKSQKGSTVLNTLYERRKGEWHTHATHLSKYGDYYLTHNIDPKGNSVVSISTAANGSTAPTLQEGGARQPRMAPVILTGSQGTLCVGVWEGEGQVLVAEEGGISVKPETGLRVDIKAYTTAENFLGKHKVGGSQCSNHTPPGQTSRSSHGISIV
jgi:hypothetical protein